MLHEVAAEYLERDELPPKPLANYAATCLRAHPGRKKQRQPSKRKQSHKTDYRDCILALTVDDVAWRFKLNPTRNRESKEEKDCGCSIVAKATKKSEGTVQTAWYKYQGIADRRTPTNYVAQAMVFLPSDSTRGLLVRFPRVGSIEATPQPSNRKAQRAQCAKAHRAKRASHGHVEE